MESPEAMESPDALESSEPVDSPEEPAAEDVDQSIEADSVALEEPGPGDATVTPLTVDLTYPSRPESTAGPRDAEALWVRGNRIYLASKTVLRGTVLRGPAIDPLPGSAVLRTVGVAPGVVTDATVLADGRLVLRNYSHAFVIGPSWEVVQTVPLPEARLGESVAAPPRGDWVYAGAEGAGSTVCLVQVGGGGGPDRDEGPAAHRLDESRTDELVEVLGHPRQHGSAGEDDEGDHREPACAPQVRQAARQRHHQDVDEQVTVDDPARLAELRPRGRTVRLDEIREDRRQRDRRDHQLEPGQEHARAEDGQQHELGPAVHGRGV